ncbi:MAG: M23 family metallopeptidase [bacterium]|nr:M23 family metallopeptidase [bacterium]
MSELPQFSQFGKIDKTPFRTKLLRFILFLAVLLLLSPLVYAVYRSFFADLSDISAPAIHVVKLPKSIGTEEFELHFTVQDTGSDVDSWSVYLDSGDRRQTLARENLSTDSPGTVHNVSLTLTVPVERLADGDATLVVQAVDKSPLRNSNVFEVQVLVDLARPSVVRVLGPEIVDKADIGVVFVEISEPHLASVTFTTPSGRQFPGFRLKDLEPEKDYPDNVWGAFFANGEPLISAQARLELMAVDQAGHELRESYPLAVISGAKFNCCSLLSADLPKIKVDESFWRSRLSGPDSLWPARDSETRADTRRSVYQRLQALIAANEQNETEQLRPYLLQLTPRRAWERSFANFSNSNALKTFSGFSWSRLLEIPGEEQLRVELPGTYLTVRSGAEAIVVAANRGDVVFSDKLGLFGHTVVIRHGAGISSLYAGLSRRLVFEGTKVGKFQQIGDQGNSSLMPGGGFLYQLRVGGYPVNPEFFQSSKRFIKYYAGIIERLDRRQTAHREKTKS